MRKDSEMFLKKILNYRDSTGKNNFELNYQYFDDIPSIETAVYDILTDLKKNNCLTSKSQVIDLEGDISINLTLDGITYFDDEKERKSSVIVNVSGGQVNISTDNGMVNASQNNEAQKVEKRIIIEDKSNNYNQNPNKKSGELDNGTMLLGGVALIFAVGFYVQYRWYILLGFIVISMLIELLTGTIYYKGKKNGILYDKNLKQIGIFNIVSVSLIPTLVGIISSPIYNSKMDFDYLKQQIINYGPIQAYFTNPSGQYAMFQMVGLFFTGLFLIYIVWSDLYIIAVLNVAMEKKGQKFWKLLLKWTCGKTKDGGKHIKAGIILIVISVIMTIGILPYILSLIQQNSQM